MALQPITSESLNRINILVYGQPGIGKTSLARTIPEAERVCVLSAESGLLSIKDLVDSGRLTGIIVNSFKDFEEAYQQLAQNPEWQKAYDWIFIDSLSEISSLCQEQAMAKHASVKDTWKMWGEYTDDMFRLVKGFRDLRGYNVVFTALEATEVDEVKRRFIGPDVSGKKLKERLPAMFDEVFYMTLATDLEGNQRRALCTSPSTGYPAKDRSGRLAPLESPNLAEIKAKILGGQSS